MLFVLATGKVRLPVPRAALIVALTYLALSHVRHVMLFGIAAPLLAAPGHGRKPGPQKRNRPDPAPKWPWRCAGVAAAGATGLPAARGEDPVTPVTALAHVPAALRASRCSTPMTMAAI